MEGANFRPYTLEKQEIYHMENEERKTGVLRKYISNRKEAHGCDPHHRASSNISFPLQHDHWLSHTRGGKTAS